MVIVEIVEEGGKGIGEICLIPRLVRGVKLCYARNVFVGIGRQESPFFAVGYRWCVHRVIDAVHMQLT